MIEEMEAKKIEETQLVELFAAFFISVLCEEPPIAIADLPESSSPGSTPSPLSSPEKPNLEYMENRRLQLRVRNLQAMLDEKQEQLIKKGEVLVEYQTNNVKSLGDLAQAMKEKMSKEVEVEALKKSLEASQALAEEKERENQALRMQLSFQDDTDRDTLQSCQEELDHLREENRQLREKLKLQQKEFEFQKELLIREEDVQLSRTPVLQSPSSLFSSVESIGKLWEWESSSPVPQSLFRLYELQRDLFFITRQLVREAWLDHSHFLKVWSASCRGGRKSFFGNFGSKGFTIV